VAVTTAVAVTAAAVAAAVVVAVAVVVAAVVATSSAVVTVAVEGYPDARFLFHLRPPTLLFSYPNTRQSGSSPAVYANENGTYSPAHRQW